MWKVDVGGGVRFSDRLSGQEVLFSGDTVDVSPLRTALLKHFAGQSVPVEAIETFVLVETPFSASHYKKPVLRELEQAGIINVLTPRKRPLTYPPGTKIRFPN